MAEQNEPLSEREIEILRLVATGAANKEIAYRLVISPNTVKVHLRNIFTKIGVSSRTEATLYAVKTGLVTPVTDGAAAEETLLIDDTASSDFSAGASPAGAASSQPSGLTRGLKTWHWALGLAVLMILVVVLFTSARLLAPPAAAPTVAAESALLPAVSPRWSGKASLPSPRKGMGYTEYDNAFYLIAGETADGIDGQLLRYSPTSDTWETLTGKPTPVTDVKAVVLGEKIYVPGGRLSDGSAASTLQVYDPRQDSWESKASLPVPLWGYALASFEGQLYLFGGKNENQYVASTYAYLPQEDRWEERTAMSTARAYATAVVIGNKIHILGGLNGTRLLDLNEAYFPTRDASSESAWETFTPLPTPRYAMGSTYMAGLIFILGGLGEGGVVTNGGAIQYLAQTDQWFEFDSPPHQPGALPALLTSGSFLYLLGGETSSGLSAGQQSYQAIYTISVPILRSDD